MRLVSRALFVTVPLAFAALAAPVAAQEDSMAQQWQDLKDAAGFGPDRPPIDFSERPPLVVPPTNTLPPPGSGVAALPVEDPDEIARRKALSDPRRPVPPTDPGAGAQGLAARTYLVDPPSGIRDPATVAGGIETDRAPGSAATGKHHHHRHSAAAQ